MPYIQNFTVPTFQLKLEDSPQNLIDSVNHIKQGPGQYQTTDISRFSNWIGISSFYYMIDQFEKKNECLATETDLQNFELYSLQCGNTGKIAYDLLQKAEVDVAFCNTDNLCMNNVTHYSALANFQTPEKIYSLIYDASLRQFFDTDNNGDLQDRYWREKMDGVLISNFLSSEDSIQIMYKLLTNGCAAVDQRICLAYINAFKETAKIDPEYIDNYPSPEKTLEAFILAGTPVVLKDDYKSYTALPGEADFEKQYTNMLSTQKRLNL